jgi:uncharacterized membrane protein
VEFPTSRILTVLRASVVVTKTISKIATNSISHGQAGPPGRLDMNLATPNDMFMVLRVVHTFAAAFLVGAVIFYYFLVRPSLRLIPPAHGAVITRRLATLTVYLSWTGLALLIVSGLLRLYLREELAVFLSPELFTQSHYRALALMSVAWLLLVVITFFMMLVLRTRLAGTSSLAVPPGDKQNTTHAQGVRQLDLLYRLAVIASCLALLAGFSMIEGGLF